MDASDALRILETERERGVKLFAQAASIDELDRAQIAVLGRKAPLSDVQRALGAMSGEDRRTVGKSANETRDTLQAALVDRRSALDTESDALLLEADRVDLTLPGRRQRAGSLHPFTLIQYEIVDIFTRMGYRVVEGPEVEDDWHSFDALNIPRDHPARTSMDTTFVDVPGHPELLLRPHTSPVQIRTMESQSPPAHVVAPGRVFRNEEITARNMPVFHQVEALAVDEGITFADMKGTIETFLRALLGPDRRVRLTPAFFPFVEPGAQADVSCFVCEGTGCRTCSF